MEGDAIPFGAGQATGDFARAHLVGTVIGYADNTIP